MSKILQKRHNQNELNTSKLSSVETLKNVTNIHRLRKFENNLKLYDPRTNDLGYREMRRPVRPSL